MKLNNISKLLVLVIIIFVSGCAQVSEIVPSDLKIIYEWGACHSDKEWNVLEIDSNGEAKLEGTFIKENKYAFTKKEISDIYNEVVKNNFFDLNEKYYDPNIMDGGCSNLHVKAEGKEHKVSISNMDVKEIERITDKILEILESKDPNWDAVG